MWPSALLIMDTRHTSSPNSQNMKSDSVLSMHYADMA